MLLQHCSIRAATAADGRLLARLVDAAGEGIPAYLWGQLAAAGQDPLEIGEQRARRDEGSFSYRNAWLAELQGQPAGMLLGYRQPDPYETGSLDQVPAVVRPLIELEALGPGTWYVNAVAVMPGRRGGGIGSQLMALAEELAGRAGCLTLSLVVAEENRGAVALYRRLGYVEIARRPVASFPGCRHGGDWLLMTRPVATA